MSIEAAVAVVRWEEPPPLSPIARGAVAASRERAGERWLPIVATLQLHPGRWAVLLETPSQGAATGIAWRIRRGAIAGFEPHEWEAETRTRGGHTTLYARYVGGDEPRAATALPGPNRYRLKVCEACGATFPPDWSGACDVCTPAPADVRADWANLPTVHIGGVR